MKINVSLPINVQDKDLELFKPYLSYILPRLNVKYFEGAFVTSSGLVCTSKGLVKECCHHTWELQFEICLKEASQYYHDAYEDTDNLIILDNEETYLVSHHPWFRNYYHWINETLLRLWMVKDKTKDMILLLPPLNELPKFAMDSLSVFTFKSIYHIPSKKSVLIRNLCMPELKPTMPSYNPKGILRLNEIFIKHYSVTHNINLGKKIYVSRRKSRRRWISNEAEVINVVQKYGYKVIYNEDYSFADQVSIYSNAKYMISIHGAGMTNMLFMQKGSIIFELCKKWIDLNDKHNHIFWYMANALKHKFYYQICNPLNPDEHYSTADIIVDIELLKKNLDLM